MPREDPDNADAAAKLAFIQGRRKSVDLCGREGRRRVAFEKTAKRMLRYLEDSDDVKVASLNHKNSWKYRRKQTLPSGKLPSRQ